MSKKVHFICMGNAYRSRMAEAYLNSLQLEGVEAFSSGVVAAERSEYTRPIAAKTTAFLMSKGLGDYTKPGWDQLDQDRVDQGDITVCMNQTIREKSSELVELPSDTLTWEADDHDEGGRALNTDEELMNYTSELFEKIKNATHDLLQEIVGIKNLPISS